MGEVIMKKFNIDNDLLPMLNKQETKNYLILIIKEITMLKIN